jgi:hypothetical protein
VRHRRGEGTGEIREEKGLKRRGRKWINMITLFNIAHHHPFISVSSSSKLTLLPKHPPHTQEWHYLLGGAAGIRGEGKSKRRWRL